MPGFPMKVLEVAIEAYNNGAHFAVHCAQHELKGAINGGRRRGIDTFVVGSPCKLEPQKEIGPKFICFKMQPLWKVCLLGGGGAWDKER